MFVRVHIPCPKIYTAVHLLRTLNADCPQSALQKENVVKSLSETRDVESSMNNVAREMAMGRYAL